MPHFKNAQESHQHSLETLNELYEHDDFMESVGRVVDLGCGQEALDLHWWATRTTRDEAPVPLNIKCVGMDLVENISAEAKAVASYQQVDIETLTETKRKYDVLWCHDTFQYMVNPLQTLANWWNIAEESGMLVLIVPQTTNVEFNRLAFDQPSGCYYNHTLVSLIHMLAVTGWDCSAGFFSKRQNDPWLRAIVYRSNTQPRNPKTTNWYNLAELGLLPASAVDSINKYGHVRQQDLLLPWLDKSLTWFGQH
jgi:SAM-dependent methyltransferase